MDISFLMDYVDLVTLGICLCVGFALKYAKLFEKLGNHYIPLIMLVLGCIINIVTNIGSLSPAVILSGMISGLASTGFYEMVRNLIGNKEE